MRNKTEKHDKIVFIIDHSKVYNFNLMILRK